MIKLCKCHGIVGKASIVNDVTICDDCGLPCETPGLWIRFRNWWLWFNSPIEEKIDNERERESK